MKQLGLLPLLTTAVTRYLPLSVFLALIAPPYSGSLLRLSLTPRLLTASVVSSSLKTLLTEGVSPKLGRTSQRT